MFKSQAFQSLNATQQALIPLMQIHWRNDKPVSYGVREAEGKLHCRPNTAMKAFKILQDRGFIICMEESFFNSKTGSKPREWLLTWMPYLDKFPSNEWEQWTPSK